MNFDANESFIDSELPASRRRINILPQRYLHRTIMLSPLSTMNQYASLKVGIITALHLISQPMMTKEINKITRQRWPIRRDSVVIETGILHFCHTLQKAAFIYCGREGLYGASYQTSSPFVRSSLKIPSAATNRLVRWMRNSEPQYQLR